MVFICLYSISIKSLFFFFISLFSLLLVLFKKIVTNSKNDSEIWKKAFHRFVELVETNLLICNILHFDQYSRLAIRLNIFLFSANNSKTKSKFGISFPLACRSCWDKSIDVQYQRFKIKTKSGYSFEYRGTDRRTESISECTLVSNDIWHAYQSWK